MYTKIHYQPPKGGAFAPPLPPLNLPLSVFEPMPSLTLKSVLFGFLTSVSANYLQTNQQFMWDLWLKVVPEMLTQGTWVWMLFVHMSKPQVCKKKQLVSVYIWESSMKKHMIVSKRRSFLLQNAEVPEGFHSATIFWTPKLYVQLDSFC